MGIKSTYNIKEFNSSLTKQQTKLIDHIISRFFDIGKQAVKKALTEGNYLNITGVLRSSIGCGIVHKGVIVDTYGFFPILSGGQEGADQGLALLHTLAQNNVRYNQVTLIVVAGADYASFVESNDNFQVLEASEEFIKNGLQYVLQQLNSF